MAWRTQGSRKLTEYRHMLHFLPKPARKKLNIEHMEAKVFGFRLSVQMVISFGCHSGNKARL